jgi:lysozyme
MIPGTDSIIDLSHWNTVSSFPEIKASSVQAMMHKCSQGLWSDPTYAARRAEATAAKIITGAYHFGVAFEDPVKQADYFMGMMGAHYAIPAPSVLALDWEWNQSNTMTAKQAGLFVQRIYQRTGGSWPMLYTSAVFLKLALVDADPETLGYLHNCDLWLTGFTPEPVLPAGWTAWRIWQHGIGSCPGVVGQVDRDTFNGTPEQLTAYFIGFPNEVPNL